jgi:hypothetical protein
MRKALTTTLTLSAVAALGLVTSTSAATAGDREDRSGGRDRGAKLEVVGLAGDRTLVRFDTRRPGDARVLGDVQGLAHADHELVGIDHRVQDGRLYGVGRGGGVYAIDTATRQASKAAQLTIALQGQDFGVDFNPAANALRIVSDTGQNLRQPFATAGAATVADVPLSTPPAAGPTTGVTGAAYTNNDLDPATATTLYDLATATDQVVLQSPANAGTLAATGTARVDLTGDTGFDIHSDVRDGLAGELSAYAVNGGRLYRVVLTNGQLADVGRIGGRDLLVTDLAIPLDQR